MNKKSKVIYVVVSLITVALFFTACGMTPPDEYVIGDNRIDSITKVVGPRKMVDEFYEDSEEMQSLIYRYAGVDSVRQDIVDYANYLQNEEGFTSLLEVDLMSAPGVARLARNTSVEGKIFAVTIVYRDKSYDLQIDYADGNVVPKSDTGTDANQPADATLQDSLSQQQTGDTAQQDNTAAQPTMTDAPVSVE